MACLMYIFLSVQNDFALWGKFRSFHSGFLRQLIIGEIGGKDCDYKINVLNTHLRHAWSDGASALILINQSRQDNSFPLRS